MTSLPVVAGTLLTDPRSGGIKRSSGVNVLPSVAEAWAEVRNDSNPSVDWIIVGYDGSSKTDIALLNKGSGGINACSAALPEGRAVFGGCRRNGRFVTFYYSDEKTPTMQRGRASMHKNGVLNVLEGSDGEIDMIRGIAEQEAFLPYEGTSPALNIVDYLKATARDSVPLATRSEPESNSPATQVPSASPPTQPLTEETGYSDLRGIVDASNFPQGADALNRELSLSDEEFVSMFGMEKKAFHRLSGWKRTSLKKQHGLF